MGTYVQLMPRMVQRRMEEMESKAAEAAKAAATPAAVETENSEATPAFQTPLNSPSLSNVPSSGTVIPEVQSSDLKSAGLEILADPSVMGAKVSSTKPLTPKTEAVLKDVSLGAGSPDTAEPSSPKPAAPTES